MENSKKRKPEDNGENGASDFGKEEVKLVIETLSQQNLINLLQDASLRHPDVLEEVHKVADRDVDRRKVFVRGLGWDTKAEALKKVFSKYGEVEDTVVVIDKKTQRGRGYGFVTYAHLDSTLRALKEPNKTVEGRVTVCALASGEGGKAAQQEVNHSKIFVGSVPEDLSAEKLHEFFSQYGEIAEGPLGYSKSGKSRGYALIIYKTLEGARKALEDPHKTIDGAKLRCKLSEGGPMEKDNGESKEGFTSQTSAKYSTGGAFGGYSLPNDAIDPSSHSSMFSNPLNSYSGLGLSASRNASHSGYPSSIESSLMSSFYPLSTDNAGQGFLSGLGQGLHQGVSSVGLASLGSPSGAYAPPYPRFAPPLYDAGMNATSQGGGFAPPSDQSGATLAERARIAGALGKLANYMNR